MSALNIKTSYCMLYQFNCLAIIAELEEEKEKKTNKNKT
jgi:hypothetical protein